MRSDVTDLLTMLVALAHGAYEASPVPAAILAHLGLGGFTTTKVVFVAVMCANLANTHRAYPKHRLLTHREVQLYCVVVALIVASHVWVITRVVA